MISENSRKIKKVVASDGQYFESRTGNHFLRIKPQILEKNGGSKVVHLIKESSYSASY